MPREGGAPSKRRRHGYVGSAFGYWIIRRSLSSGRPLRAGPVGGWWQEK